MRLLKLLLLMFNLFCITSFRIVGNHFKNSWKIAIISFLAGTIFSAPGLLVEENYDINARFAMFFKNRTSSLFMYMCSVKGIISSILGFLTSEYINSFKSKNLINLFDVCRKYRKLVHIDVEILENRIRKKLNLLFLAYVVGRSAEFMSLEQEKQSFLTLLWAFTNDLLGSLSGALLIFMLIGFVEFFELAVDVSCQRLDIVDEKSIQFLVHHFNTLEFEIFKMFNETFSKTYKLTIVFFAVMLTVRVSKLRQH